MKKIKYSHKDSRGRLWVACSECERGGNSGGEDLCACGWRVKRFNGLGCFSGKLLKGDGTDEETN